MATIYKLKQDNGSVSKANYTLSGARETRKKLENLGINTKIIVHEEYQIITDTMADITGKVRYYRIPTDKELKALLKAEQRG